MLSIEKENKVIKQKMYFEFFLNTHCFAPLNPKMKIVFCNLLALASKLLTLLILAKFPPKCISQTAQEIILKTCSFGQKSVFRS